MSTHVGVSTYAHSVTYVTDNLLGSLKEVIRASGLDPDKLADNWELYERGIRTWLETRDLVGVKLEVFLPSSSALVGRWDFDIHYGAAGDGTMWVDTEDIRYHILKQGIWPSQCDYEVILTTKNGRPDVPGWAPGTLRSTDGFIRQSLGTTIDGNGLQAAGSYWRKR